MRHVPEVSVVNGDNPRQILAVHLQAATYSVYARIGHDSMVSNAGTAELAFGGETLTRAGGVADVGPQELVVAEDAEVAFTLRSSTEEFGTTYCEWIDIVGGAGEAGPAGPEGPEGPAGPQGPAGATGPAAAVNVTVTGQFPLTGLVGSPTIAGAVDE